MDMVLATAKNHHSLPFFGDAFNIEHYGKLFTPSTTIECVLPSLPGQCAKWHILYNEEPQKLRIIQVILKDAQTHSDNELLIGLTRYFKEVELSKTEALDRICNVSLKFK